MRRILSKLMPSALLLLIVSLLSMSVFAAEISLLEGDVIVSGSVTQSGSTITATANAGRKSTATNSFEVKNNSGSKAQIKFTWEAYASNDTGASCTIGSEVTSMPEKGYYIFGNFSGTMYSGEYTGTLDAGGTISIVLYAKGGTYVSNNATLNLTGFTCTPVSDSYDVSITVEGNGTVTLDGDTVTSGSSYAVEPSGSTLVANPGSGSTFLGWVDSNNLLLSASTSYTIKPTSDTSVKAVFGSSATAWFMASRTAGEQYLYNDLTAAANKAATLTDKTVVLMNNGTLSGSHTIPSGVTLLIPFDAANTLYITEPGLFTYDPAKENFNTYGAKVYHTLTMANGANITVNGAISVSAKQSASYGSNGSPIKEYGLINMNSGSKITVENGGALYAWGYITGSGSVEIESGGEVRECFQMADYRGGAATTAIVNKDDEYGVFPFNQYYLQNVEVPMTLHSGAIEYGYCAVDITVAGTQRLKVPFVGTSDSMFVINSGYIVKDYIEGTGRMKVQVHGDMAITPVSMTFKVNLIGQITIDSSKYALPIPHHFTVSVESGNINMNQSVAFLPGSEFIVREGATCTLGKDKKVYIYDWDEWLYNNGANGYSGTGNYKYVKLPYVPGGNGTTGREKDAQIQIYGTVDTSAGSVYVTASGANIFSTGTGVFKTTPGTATSVYQVITKDTDVASWPKINITPAQLKNADSTVVTTGDKPAGTYTYTNGVWKFTCAAHTEVTDAAVAPTCTETGLTEGKHCSVCNAVLVAQEVIDKDPDAHNWGQDGLCTNGCGLFKIYASSVQAGDDLKLYFYVRADHVADLDSSAGNYSAKITRYEGNSDKQIETAEIVCTQWTDFGGGLYRFFYDGIAAKEMTDEFTVTIYKGDKAVSAPARESVAGYAIRSLNNSLANVPTGSKKEVLRTTLVDMLNYGAASQLHFGYNTDLLANADLSETQKEYGSDNADAESTGSGNLTYFAGNNVTLESSLAYTFYLNDAALGKTVKVSYVDHYGASKGFTCTVTEDMRKTPSGSTQSYLAVQVTGLAIADGRQEIHCDVIDGETVLGSATGSIESYIKGKLSKNETEETLKAVVQSLINFVDSAHAYFHSAANDG